MKIYEIIMHLEKLAPPGLQESYDNSGLILGDGNREATGAILCLDSIEEVIDEAISKNCNLIIAHHPIIFSGIKSITGKNYIERTLIKAIKNDIAIYAIHTNLDNVAQGVNQKICDRLGLKNLSILSPKKGNLRKLYTFIPLAHTESVRNAVFDAGGGKVGLYDRCSFNILGTGTFRAAENASPHLGEKGKDHHEEENKVEIIFPEWMEARIVSALIKSHPYEEVAYDIVKLENINPETGLGMIGMLEKPIDEGDMLSMIAKQMQTSCIRHTGLLGEKVSKVAVCGGSGSFLLNQAIHAGADFFITGDFKYHQFFDADKHLVIADIGHFESEQFTPDLIYEYLTKKFTNFALHLTTVNTNPVKYYFEYGDKS